MNCTKFIVDRIARAVIPFQQSDVVLPSNMIYKKYLCAVFKAKRRFGGLYNNTKQVNNNNRWI